MVAFDKRRLLEFVGSHPRARVKDFCEAFLGGMVLESKGGTSRAYQAVNAKLRFARRKLGLPPLGVRGPDVVPRTKQRKPVYRSD
jgi:hypothetical protein